MLPTWIGHILHPSIMFRIMFCQSKTSLSLIKYIKIYHLIQCQIHVIRIVMKYTLKLYTIGIVDVDIFYYILSHGQVNKYLHLSSTTPKNLLNICTKQKWDKTTSSIYFEKIWGQKLWLWPNHHSWLIVWERINLY
jgi:hypothetical protein